MEHKKKFQLKKAYNYEKKVARRNNYILSTLNFNKKALYKDISLELSNLKYKIKLYSNYYKYSFLEERFLSFHLNRLYDHAFFLFPSNNYKIFYNYKKKVKYKSFLSNKINKKLIKNFFYFI